MSYRDLLHPWCIVRLLPKLQSVTVARFRRRSEAENQLQLLRRMVPTASYIILFDVPVELKEEEILSETESLSTLN